MAYQTQTAVDVPSSVAAGAAFDSSKANSFTVYVTGLVGTWKLQVSPDGTNWFDFGSAVVNAGYITCNAQAKFARVNVTAYTSGTAAGVMQNLYAQDGG